VTFAPVEVRLNDMKTTAPSLSPETEAAVLAHQGHPITASGAQGLYVVLRSEVYDAMLGLTSDEESETLAAIRRGIAQLDAGQSRPASEFFEELRRKYES